MTSNEEASVTNEISTRLERMGEGATKLPTGLTDEHHLECLTTAKSLDVAAPSPSGTQLLDLPDELLAHLFSFLDIRSRLRARVSRRLDRIEAASQKVVKRIAFMIYATGTELWDFESERRPASVSSFSFKPIADGLTRVARSTTARSLRIKYCGPMMAGSVGTAALAAILTLRADALHVCPPRDTAAYRDEYNIDDDYGTDPLPDVDAAVLMGLTERVREAAIDFVLVTPSPQELVTLHQTLLGGGCKMEQLTFRVREDVALDFLEERFGLSVEETEATRVFRSTDPALEVYSKCVTEHCELKLSVYDGQMRTVFRRFKKSCYRSVVQLAFHRRPSCESGERTGDTIEFDHAYVREEERWSDSDDDSN